MADKPENRISALHELDACKATMNNMSEEIAALRDLLRQATNLLNTFMLQQPPDAPEKLGRGRPKKNKNDGWELEAYSKMKAAFVAANKLKRPTDVAVTTWYFEQEFKRQGLRESRAAKSKFQSKLKVFLNRLGDLRNPISKTPI